MLLFSQLTRLFYSVEVRNQCYPFLELTRAVNYTRERHQYKMTVRFNWIETNSTTPLNRHNFIRPENCPWSVMNSHARIPQDGQMNNQQSLSRLPKFVCNNDTKIGRITNWKAFVCQWRLAGSCVFYTTVNYPSAFGHMTVLTRYGKRLLDGINAPTMESIYRA